MKDEKQNQLNLSSSSSALCITRTDINAVKENEKEAYRALILTEAIHFFDFPSPSHGPSVLIEARIDQQLVGLALAKTYSEANYAELNSLVVAEAYRRQGIGKALFGFLQERLSKDEKMHFMRIFYDKATPSGEAVSKIIASYGWSPPTLYIVKDWNSFILLKEACK